MSDATPPPPPEPTEGATPPSPPPAPTPPPVTPPPTSPPPPAPPAGVAPVPAPGAVPQNGMGTAALVMGILQFICLGPIASILAIVFGAIGLKKVKQGVANNKGVAMTGLILGIVGIVLSIIGLILVLVLGVFAASTVNESVDPAKNAKTGLMDGMYGMEPTSYINLSAKCSFTGKPVDVQTQTPAGPAVTVVGTTAAECGDGMSNPKVVLFEVSGGVAKIVGVE